MTRADPAGPVEGLGPTEQAFLLENLPWYVNGTLDAEAAATIATWSSRLPAVRSLVEEERRLAQCLARRIETLPRAPGVRALQARLDEARRAQAPGDTAPGDPAGAALARRELSRFDLARRGPPRVDPAAWGPARGGHARVRWAAALLTLLCVAPILAPPPHRAADQAEVSAMRAVPPAEVPLLRVRFRSAASGAEIIRTLRLSQAEVVAGPDGFGDFRLRARVGGIAALRLALLRSGTVLQAELEGGTGGP